jgi:hypothetical protein
MWKRRPRLWSGTAIGFLQWWLILSSCFEAHHWWHSIPIAASKQPNTDVKTSATTVIGNCNRLSPMMAHLVKLFWGASLVAFNTNCLFKTTEYRCENGGHDDSNPSRLCFQFLHWFSVCMFVYIFVHFTIILCQPIIKLMSLCSKRSTLCFIFYY